MSNFCLVAPYRNREAHLKRWLRHYKDFGIPLVVIEQADDKPFNRAKLFNAFFIEEGYKYDYAVYHDVDMYLTSGREAFDFPINPTHIATYISQFNWKNKRDQSKWTESYAAYFGGVCLLSSQQMVQSGGWSNEIYGWGHEDDEMRKNLLAKGFTIDRRKAYFECEDHHREIISEEFKKNSKYLLEGRRADDGIETCKYELISKEQGVYLHIKVKL